MKDSETEAQRSLLECRKELKLADMDDLLDYIKQAVLAEAVRERQIMTARSTIEEVIATESRERLNSPWTIAKLRHVLDQLPAAQRTANPPHTSREAVNQSIHEHNESFKMAADWLRHNGMDEAAETVLILTLAPITPEILQWAAKAIRDSLPARSPEERNQQEETMARKSKVAPKVLPKDVRIFVNDFSGDDPYLQICESAEEAFTDSEGEDIYVGVYELKGRVKLKFRVDEIPE